jgi:hypothetical protein
MGRKAGSTRDSGRREVGREPGWDGAVRPVTVVRGNASPTGELKRKMSRV